METKKEKGKGTYHFNGVDVLILLALVAVVAAVVLVLGLMGGGNNDQTVKLEYVVEISPVRDELLGKIRVGDTLIDSAGKYNIGTVKSVESVPYTEEVLNSETGEVVSAPYPEHSTLRVTVTANATESGGYYSIGGFRISAGLRVYSRFPDFLGEGYCVSLHAIGD